MAAVSTRSLVLRVLLGLLVSGMPMQGVRADHYYNFNPDPDCYAVNSLECTWEYQTCLASPSDCAYLYAAPSFLAGPTKANLAKRRAMVGSSWGWRSCGVWRWQEYFVGLECDGLHPHQHRATNGADGVVRAQYPQDTRSLHLRRCCPT
jgi:hypothetical protein